MFTCRESVDLLIDFVDGTLPAAEADHLREHMDACPPCVEFLQSYRATPTLCRRALARQMPREVADRLAAFLRARLHREGQK